MIIAMNTLACEQWPVATPARYNGERIKEQMKEMETGLIMGSTESNKRNLVTLSPSVAAATMKAHKRLEHQRTLGLETRDPSDQGSGAEGPLDQRAKEPGGRNNLRVHGSLRFSHLILQVRCNACHLFLMVIICS